VTQPRVQTAERPSGSERTAPALHVVTFGCQMNKYDSLLVEGRFGEHGYRMVPSISEADVVLFNTCSVRDHAEERVYSWLGELRRTKERRPEMVIGVMGCMAQRAEEEILQRAAHVDLVCGTRRLQHLPQLVDEVRALRDRRATAPPAEHLVVPRLADTSRVADTSMESDVRVDRSAETYADGLVGHLAVMRGCDLNCTFCIVPTVRGRVRSRPIDELVREARWMVDGGARAIVLLGQTIDAWGEDLDRPGPGEPRGSGRQGRPGLAELLRALQEVDGLERLRLITLHPSYTNAALAEAIRDCDKVDRFLPLPAQSGSDAVLRRMKRGYNVDLYRRRVDVLREAVPDLELGSDWIVGFPGETDEDFARSEDFLAEVGFVQNYVFKYDPRPGTAAFELEDDVPEETKKARNQALLRAAERSALARHERWIGRGVRTFVEQESAKHPGVLRGRTRHNLPISFAGPAELVGRSVEVEVDHASPFGLSGHRASG